MSIVSLASCPDTRVGRVPTSPGHRRQIYTGYAERDHVPAEQR